MYSPKSSERNAKDSLSRKIKVPMPSKNALFFLADLYFDAYSPSFHLLLIKL